MSSGITLTAATRQNLLSLQGTADLLTTTQNRLSTGKKVTSALDNPTNFFTSQSLSARSSDLSGLLDGLSNGVQTIQAANQGITSLQKLVDSAKSTAQQALADKSGGKGTILGGVGAQAAVATGTSAVTGTLDLSSLAKDASVDISLDGGATKNTLRLDASTLKSVTSDTSKVTTDQLVSALNGQIAGNTNLAGKVSASIGTNGRISFTTTDTGAAAKLSVSGSLNATTDIGFGKPATTPTAATIVAGAALGATTDLANGKSSVFSITDGNKSVTVKLDSTTATDNLGGTLGTSAADADVIKAINKQLSDAGSTVTAKIGTTADDGAAANGKIVLSSQDLGPDAQLSINPISNTAGGASGIGFSTFTAAAGTLVAPAAGTAASATGSADLRTTPPSLAGGKSATFSITDAGTTTTITIDSRSLDTAGTNAGDDATGTALGDNPTGAKLVDAINAALKAESSAAVASIDSSTGGLKFTASANNVALTATATNDTIGLGFGASGATSGSFAAGTGAAVTAIIAGGTDASDGSSKASITGTTPPTSANSGIYNTSTSKFDFSSTSPAPNASFTLQLGSGASKLIDVSSATVGNGNAVSQASVAKAINDQIEADTGLAGKVSASFVNNKLTIQSTAFGSDQSLTVKAAGSTDIGLGVSGAVAQTSTGTDIGGAKGTSSTRSTLATQYNNLLTQISQQAQDSGYNGVNLLFRNSSSANENTLKLTFNEKGTSTLDISGVKFDAEGLGLKGTTNNFQSDDEINTALNQLTAATASLRAQSSTFGSNLSVVQNRQDFSKNLINILDTGSANLTNADLNEEAANSQALSTRQSIGISALSLANTAQQGILQLLR
ncbi:flagellin [Methylobacterium sp. WCS2018Hpa-22]|uniref:flagellin N-terminal helical domain-containing protein n=1 Tax=Methylobacterium sp. WCS2018Hpa-22 TaxID=3073633 RepID=UPI00288A9F06|nr:flagellin [Methylobacterium sp. WCS2018Hpa-22]